MGSPNNQIIIDYEVYAWRDAGFLVGASNRPQELAERNGLDVAQPSQPKVAGPCVWPCLSSATTTQGKTAMCTCRTSPSFQGLRPHSPGPWVVLVPRGRRHHRAVGWHGDRLIEEHIAAPWIDTYLEPTHIVVAVGLVVAERFNPREVLKVPTLRIEERLVDAEVV